MRSGGLFAVGLYVCVCVCVCVVRLSTVFLGNRGNSERETWTYYQVGGMYGKIRFWSGEAGETDGCRGECASNRDRGRRCTYVVARVEKICSSACIDGLTSINIQLKF